jgi:hypothetical protein
MGQVKKGRQRQAEASKAAEDIAARAAAAAVVEQGPTVCRTGGEHIYLGEDTACFNGCGTTRDQVPHLKMKMKIDEPNSSS